MFCLIYNCTKGNKNGNQVINTFPNTIGDFMNVYDARYSTYFKTAYLYEFQVFSRSKTQINKNQNKVIF